MLTKTSAPLYSETTENIGVMVTVDYAPMESSEKNNYFVWSYTITIENKSNQTVQLRHRYWRVIDSYGHIEDVQGPGVVGKQPHIKPKEMFQYSSYTHLKTPSGIMMGIYEMTDEDGREFEVAIPTFSLDTPTIRCAVH